MKTLACYEKRSEGANHHPIRPDDGFTLIEVIASAVIILIATLGSIAAFNLITFAVRGTGLRADQSRRIDTQIAEISRISEFYTACSDPEGEFPSDLSDVNAACGAGAAAAGLQLTPPNSFYFFPLDDNDIDDFFEACRNSVAASHITANFIDEVDLVDPEAGEIDVNVRRDPATRVLGNDSENHQVEVVWRDAGGDVLRRFRISPLVSSWCP